FDMSWPADDPAVTRKGKMRLGLHPRDLCSAIFRKSVLSPRLPQPLGDLADRGAAHQTPTVSIGKRCLDVARRQPACEQFYRQVFQCLGAACEILPNRR